MGTPAPGFQTSLHQNLEGIKVHVLRPQGGRLRHGCQDTVHHLGYVFPVLHSAPKMSMDPAQLSRMLPTGTATQNRLRRTGRAPRRESGVLCQVPAVEGVPTEVPGWLSPPRAQLLPQVLIPWPPHTHFWDLPLQSSYSSQSRTTSDPRGTCALPTQNGATSVASTSQHWPLPPLGSHQIPKGFPHASSRVGRQCVLTAETRANS